MADGVETLLKQAVPPSAACSQRGEEMRRGLRTGIAMADDIITRVTGKALPGQRPVLDLGGLGWWIVSLSALIGHLAGLLIVLSTLPSIGWWSGALIPFLVGGIVSMTGRFRVQQVVFGHHAVHNALSRRWRWLNVLVRHVATALPLAQNPEDYRRDHVLGHHKVKLFTTRMDADAAFLFTLGFRPGMSREELYRRLWRALVQIFRRLPSKARFCPPIWA